MGRYVWMGIAVLLLASIAIGLVEAEYYANLRGDYARGCWDLLAAAVTVPSFVYSCVRCRR